MQCNARVRIGLDWFYQSTSTLFLPVLLFPWMMDDDLIIAKFSRWGRVDHQPGGVRLVLLESDRVEDGWKWLTLLPFFPSTPRGQQEYIRMALQNKLKKMQVYSRYGAAIVIV